MSEVKIEDLQREVDRVREKCSQFTIEHKKALSRSARLTIEIHHLRTRLAEVESTLNHTLTANEEGTLQWWIQKHDALLIKFADFLNQHATLEADAAVMRDALQKCHATFLSLEGLNGYSTEVPPNIVLRAVIKLSESLATNAGKSLLERLQEAEWIIGNSFNATHSGVASKEWLNRRDAFLNPTNKDVM